MPCQLGHRCLPKGGAIHTLDQPVLILLSVSSGKDMTGQQSYVRAGPGQTMVPISSWPGIRRGPGTRRTMPSVGGAILLRTRGAASSLSGGSGHRTGAGTRRVSMNCRTPKPKHPPPRMCIAPPSPLTQIAGRWIAGMWEYCSGAGDWEPIPIVCGAQTIASAKSSPCAGLRHGEGSERGILAFPSVPRGPALPPVANCQLLA